VAALVACLALVAFGAPAAAHDQLTGSDPAADSTVAAWPAEVRLEYSSELLEIGASIAVMDDAGTDWASGEPVVAGTVTTVPLRADAPNGSYVIQWRVVSSDGHPIEGTVAFTLAGPAATPSATPSASPSASALDSPGPTASGQPTAAAASPTAQPSPAQPDPRGGERGTLGPWGVVGLAVLAAMLTGAAVWRRRGVDSSRLGGPSDQAD